MAGILGYFVVSRSLKASSLSRYRFTFPSSPLSTRSIQERLTWAMVSLITITVVVASLVTVRNASDQEELKLFHQADHDIGLVSAAFGTNAELLQAQADLLAGSAPVHVAIAGGDRSQLAQFLAPRTTLLRVDAVEVAASDGTVLVRPDGPPSATYDPMRIPSMRSALAGTAATGVEPDDPQSPGSTYTLRSAVPILESGRVVGVLALGRRVDGSLAQQLAAYAGTDATVVMTSGRLIVASTQRDPSGASIVGRVLPDQFASRISGQGAGGKYVDRSTLFGLDAVYAVVPYAGGNGAPEGYLVVAEPLTLARAVVMASAPRIAQAFIGVLLLGLLVSWLVGRTISRPIRRLSRAAARIAHGDLDAPIHPEGHDEVAALAGVMEKMRLGLSQLLEGSRTLAASLDQEEVLTTLCSLAGKALGGNRAFVFMLADDERTIEDVSAIGIDTATLRHELVSVRHDALLEAVALGNEPILIGDAARHRLGAAPAVTRSALRSVLALPLPRGERLAGILVVGYTLKAGRFTADQVRLAEAFGRQALVAIEHARLYRDAWNTSRYLEGVISTTPDAIATLDGEGYFEYVNEPTCTQLGYARDELIHRHFTMCFPPDQQTVAHDQWDHLKATGISEFTTTLQRKSGELRTTFVKIAAIEAGRRYVAIARDVTEQEQLLQEIQQRNKELDTLYKVADTVSASLDVGAVLQQALALVLETMHADAGRIYLLDRDACDLELAAQVGALDRSQQGLDRMRVGERVTGMVAQQRTPIVVDDIQQDPRASQQAKDEGIRSYAGIPLMTKREVVGVMSVESYRIRRFLPREVDLLSTIGHQIAVAIENGRLYERARELAVSEERNRLARDIHDTLAQGLMGITLQLELAKSVLHEEPELGLDCVDKALTLARSNLDEARRSVLDLRAAPLQELTLPEALERLGLGIEQESGLTISFQQLGDTRMGRLPARVEAGLYRIAQEALTNVRRHARATHVDVMVTYDGRELHLVVQDDGAGFDPSEPRRVDDRGGFGLVGIQERARLLGGSAEISSAPEMGTRVEVTVPDTWSRFLPAPRPQEVAGARAAG